MRNRAKPSAPSPAASICTPFDIAQVFRATRSGVEQHRCPRQCGKTPVRVCRRVDRPLLDDVADNHVAVGVGGLEDDRRAIRPRKRPAAARAIVVGGHHEPLRRIDRCPVPRKVHDPAGRGIDHRTVLVEFRRLRQVDPVRHPIDHVEVVAGEVRVDQRLICPARRDLVEDPGRPFQPVLHLGPRDNHGAHRVGIKVQVRHILDRHIADRHVGVILRPTATARLERGRSRQQRQVGIFRPRKHLRDVPALRNRHDLHRRIVSHQGEVAVQGRLGLAHRAADIIQRGVMFGLRRRQHLWRILDQR